MGMDRAREVGRTDVRRDASAHVERPRPQMPRPAPACRLFQRRPGHGQRPHARTHARAGDRRQPVHTRWITGAPAAAAAAAAPVRRPSKNDATIGTGWIDRCASRGRTDDDQGLGTGPGSGRKCGLISWGTPRCARAGGWQPEPCAGRARHRGGAAKRNVPTCHRVRTRDVIYRSSSPAARRGPSLAFWTYVLSPSAWPRARACMHARDVQ